MKVIKVGLDLDGVIVDKPPLISKNLLEWLVRSHQSKGLAYRFPESKIEQWLRIFTHHPLFRPPIKKNLEFVKKLAKKGKYRLYLVSARYSFLEERTWQWLRFHQIDHLFAAVHLNLKNEQPHLFKEKVIRKLNPDFFIDDDFPLTKYLRKNLEKVSIFCFPYEVKKLKEEILKK